MTRFDRILSSVNTAGCGLEIGPSFAPAAPKSKGFNVEILDCLSAEDLKIKYANMPIENIEPVDYVWSGEPIDKLINKPNHYDYIIASHVIEHLPDMLSWLQQCSNLLKPDGVLSLAIPDKRYIFDYLRWPSTTGDVLQAFSDKASTHSMGTLFDNAMLTCLLNNNCAWGSEYTGKVTLANNTPNINLVYNNVKQAIDCNKYTDAHKWVFTPTSFRLLLADIQQLGLSDLCEFASFDTIGCEFFISLRKSTSTPAAVDRLVLYKQMLTEMHATMLNYV